MSEVFEHERGALRVSPRHGARIRRALAAAQTPELDGSWACRDTNGTVRARISFDGYVWLIWDVIEGGRHTRRDAHATPLARVFWHTLDELGLSQEMADATRAQRLVLG